VTVKTIMMVQKISISDKRCFYHSSHIKNLAATSTLD